METLCGKHTVGRLHSLNGDSFVNETQTGDGSAFNLSENERKSTCFYSQWGHFQTGWKFLFHIHKGPVKIMLHFFL